MTKPGRTFIQRSRGLRKARIRLVIPHSIRLIPNSGPTTNSLLPDHGVEPNRQTEDGREEI
jgi:hypothetical protein